MLNSIFQKTQKLKSEHAALDEEKQVCKESEKRKIRSDKMKDVKFPVNEEERTLLRRIAKSKRKQHRNETESNTEIFLAALNHLIVHPDRCHIIHYKDTGQYMHVRLSQNIFNEVEDLSYKWNVSIRCAVHRIMMNYLKVGEVVIKYVEY
ncbi:hypothetical protein M5X00_13360 [Paenibacillus alvei]|uniref:hypothetical protein n=2 Tax=Paenibacillus alvei TaxID=44250 RepID=UPI00028979E1|nr:hypothetical protein [Paenibacillus alvei]EJW13883.1 hypothetical protein PAV_109p01130 [Paenibacillus alvei DSM 29]MCY9540488.1 hypothetical protein [Paenibacillus alvei]MCY9733005.1 hypothetical protein [Paenibacillus alvei]MCY9755229.1 hypothetical protein [Paenibacillus alvei]MEC0080293.1 hypothetical protein [Paenibacillus alvei]